MAGATNLILKPFVESIYVDENKKTHTRYYSKNEMEQSKNDIQIIRKKYSAVRQGRLDGQNWSVEGDLDGDVKVNELALTCIMQFVNSVGKEFTCRYLLHKYMTGSYNVQQPTSVRKGTIIKVERKSIEELELERIEGNFDRHYFLEDKIVK